MTQEIGLTSHFLRDGQKPLTRVLIEMSDSQNEHGTDDTERHVYKVTHCAFKTEFVVASSSEEARENASGGWCTGDYAYGHPSSKPYQAFPAEKLGQIPLVGDKTVQRLLGADSPVPLGPASDTDAIRDADVTRLRNQLETPANRPDTGNSWTGPEENDG